MVTGSGDQVAETVRLLTDLKGQIEHRLATRGDSPLGGWGAGSRKEPSFLDQIRTIKDVELRTYVEGLSRIPDPLTVDRAEGILRRILEKRSGSDAR